MYFVLLFILVCDYRNSTTDEIIDSTFSDTLVLAQCFAYVQLILLFGKCNYIIYMYTIFTSYILRGQYFASYVCYMSQMSIDHI